MTYRVDMKEQGLSDKELALLQAARREARQRKAPPPEGATTPIDQATVLGWDHPAARQTKPKVKVAAEEKWERLSALMEVERHAAQAQRQKLRRNAGYFLLTVAVLMLFWVLRVLSR